MAICRKGRRSRPANGEAGLSASLVGPSWSRRATISEVEIFTKGAALCRGENESLARNSLSVFLRPTASLKAGRSLPATTVIMQMASTAVGRLGREKAAKVCATISGLAAPRASEGARNCPVSAGFRGGVRLVVS